ncbi:unnamed protein product [Vitrella brassicaformis CCMP3155]|uniref:RING-type domain-containing protein n=2 Tax=Vitrella brassicaformis TaxID=1169539 RepID=A0A0G4FNW5_VITBC|nr:unnamed protein product [Vitrella brassicaformis CCMP3155]|eukprot:CEM15506.1 unnamed protein product [Vitrella brassicaformis CCMP3155]
MGSSRPSDLDAAIATLSSPEELQEDALDSSLKVVANHAEDTVASGLGGCEALGKKLRNQHLLRRVYHTFLDGGNTARQLLAAYALWFLFLPQWKAGRPWDIAGYLIPISGSPRTFISMLAPVLTQTSAVLVEMIAFTLLAGAMDLGRREGNAVDTRDYLVEHHPDILDKAQSSVTKIAESHCPSDRPCGRAALAFIRTAFDTAPADGPPFPPTVMPIACWVGVFRVFVECLTSREAETRDKMRDVQGVITLLCSNMQYVTTNGSDDERAAYLAAMRQDIFPFVDTCCGLLASPDAERAVRDGAARCVGDIFFFCDAFAQRIGFDWLASGDQSPVQRLMRAPGALKAFVTIMKDSVIDPTWCDLTVLHTLAGCGYRDELYGSGCISLVSELARASLAGNKAAILLYIKQLPVVVGGPAELVDARAKIAVREGLPVALCQLCQHVLVLSSKDTNKQETDSESERALRHFLPVDIKLQFDLACINQPQVDSFIDFVVETLRALVSYDDRVSSKRGGVFRPNVVTRAVLQHDSVKTMRAADQQPKGRRKANRQQQQQQQPTVPQKLLDLFDDIEEAANERADALAEQVTAELAEDDTQDGGKHAKTSKGAKKSKGKRGGKGDNSTKTTGTKTGAAPSSSAAAIGTSDEHSEQQQQQQQDTEDHHLHLPGPPSPSPSSPPRPSCSYSSSSASAAGGTSVSVGGGRGQQQGAGGGCDDGGGFITVGRKKRGGKSGHTQQQQTNKADKRDDNSRVFPSSSSSESTRPSSSHPSVYGGPHNAPPLPVPLPPRPAVPPPQPPNRHTPTPAPSSSRGGSDEQGLAPLAAGGSSSSTLERAGELEGRSGQDRCGGEVSELDVLRKQLEAMRLEREAMRLEKEAIERENKRLEEERESTECDICMASKKSIVLIPCRHFCLCGGCAAALMSKPVAQRLCPRCRQAITATRHVYL